MLRMIDEKALRGQYAHHQEHVSATLRDLQTVRDHQAGRGKLASCVCQDAAEKIMQIMEIASASGLHRQWQAAHAAGSFRGRPADRRHMWGLDQCVSGAQDNWPGARPIFPACRQLLRLTKNKGSLSMLSDAKQNIPLQIDTSFRAIC